LGICKKISSDSSRRRKRISKNVRSFEKGGVLNSGAVGSPSATAPERAISPEKKVKTAAILERGESFIF